MKKPWKNENKYLHIEFKDSNCIFKLNNKRNIKYKSYYTA